MSALHARRASKSSAPLRRGSPVSRARVLYVAVDSPKALTLPKAERLVYHTVRRAGGMIPTLLRERAGINRNMVSGAVFRLRQRHLLRRVPLTR